MADTMEVRQARVDQVNRLIHVIAEHGRRFFGHGDRVSYMRLDRRGKVWFADAYTSKRIYTHYTGRWRGFTQGGTLRDLVCMMRDYIRTGDPIWARAFGPWPKWICDGDLWGYGADMQHVRDALVILDIPTYDHVERQIPPSPDTSEGRK